MFGTWFLVVGVLVCWYNTGVYCVWWVLWLVPSVCLVGLADAFGGSCIAFASGFLVAWVLVFPVVGIILVCVAGVLGYLF